MISTLYEKAIQFNEDLAPMLLEAFKAVGEGQAPAALLVGCVDSRVNLAQVLNLRPGALLQLRNVGNCIPTMAASDASVTSTLEFAIQALQLEHIIICGHSDCGAMNAVKNGVPFHGINQWLHTARNALKPSANSDLAELAQNHIINQGKNLLTYPFIKEKVEQNRLKIHHWYFDIANAKLHQYTSNGYRPISSETLDEALYSVS